ncbi:MAG: nucleoside triphosphate pyrophosphohydrolase [Proteobacteria bacterium]|nr:nucleoside triphosphate pyrophosphohydrolase [Pseudomonadota bacterium]
MPQAPKLVRDRIPALIAATGRKPRTRRLTGKRLQRALLEKLAEEYAEFTSARSAAHRVEELADIVEVARALARGYGHGGVRFERLIAKKRAARGGFTKGVFYLGDAKDRPITAPRR